MIDFRRKAGPRDTWRGMELSVAVDSDWRPRRFGRWRQLDSVTVSDSDQHKAGFFTQVRDGFIAPAH